MKSFSKYFLLTLVAFLSILNAQTFSVDSKDGRNQATFTSEAPFEKIVGVSSGLNAVAMIDINDLTSAKGKVTVPISNLKTGISLRDEHLRSENWLHAEKYPNAEFMLTGIKGAKKLSDQVQTNVTLTGKFSVHGVTNDITVPAKLTYFKESPKTKARTEGNLLVVDTKFTIKLADYNVQIPDMVKGKLSEDVEVAVNFIASDANAAAGACNPCGNKSDANPCSMKKSNPCNPCAMK